MAWAETWTQQQLERCQVEAKKVASPQYGVVHGRFIPSEATLPFDRARQKSGHIFKGRFSPSSVRQQPNTSCLPDVADEVAGTSKGRANWLMLRGFFSFISSTLFNYVNFLSRMSFIGQIKPRVLTGPPRPPGRPLWVRPRGVPPLWPLEPTEVPYAPPVPLKPRVPTAPPPPALMPRAAKGFPTPPPLPSVPVTQGSLCPLPPCAPEPGPYAPPPPNCAREPRVPTPPHPTPPLMPFYFAPARRQIGPAREDSVRTLPLSLTLVSVRVIVIVNKDSGLLFVLSSSYEQSPSKGPSICKVPP
nr:formin-like protein 1 [Penaeus vannamei]